MDRSFKKMLGLPLFQGLTTEELSELVGHTKIDFVKLNQGEVIIGEGSRVDQLRLLTDGKIMSTATVDNHSFKVEEMFDAPFVLQPERLFGLSQHYDRCFSAVTACSMLSIGKQDVVRLSTTFPVFRINLLNIICSSAQRAEQKLWRSWPSDLPGRAVRFFEQHCLRPAGEKHFHIKIETLAQQLGDSTLNTSRALHSLQKRQLIVMSRGRIIIPALEELLG